MPAAAALTAESLLGLKPTTPLALHDALLDGLPFSALAKFLEKSGLPPKDVYDVLRIPARTLVRRKAAGRLSTDESISLQRLADLFEQTLEMFSGHGKGAQEWLTEPHHVFHGRRPIELAQTPLGTTQVETLIAQIQQGVYV